MAQLVMKATAFAGNISKLDMTVIDVFGFGPMGSTITGVRNGDGDLQLIQWSVTGDGSSITRVRDAHAGAVSEIAMAELHYHVLTAVKNGSGDLEIISWSQDLVREGTAFGGKVSAIAICRFLPQHNPDHFAVAYRDSSGDLRVEVWSLSGSGTPKREGTASAGSVSEVKIAFISHAPYRFVTAVKNGSGDLQLIQWQASHDGKTITRIGSTSAGTASHISLIEYGELLVTSLENGSGDLQLISWRADASGAITRLETDLAGSVGAVSSCLSFDASGDDYLTTAVKNGSNALQLIDWKLIPSSGSLTRTASASTVETSRVRISTAWNSKNPGTVNPAPHSILITAMRNELSDLELISWARE